MCNGRWLVGGVAKCWRPGCWCKLSYVRWCWQCNQTHTYYIQVICWFGVVAGMSMYSNRSDFQRARFRTTRTDEIWLAGIFEFACVCSLCQGPQGKSLLHQFGVCRRARAYSVKVWAREAERLRQMLQLNSPCRPTEFQQLPVAGAQHVSQEQHECSCICLPLAFWHLKVVARCPAEASQREKICKHSFWEVYICT